MDFSKAIQILSGQIVDDSYYDHTIKLPKGRGNQIVQMEAGEYAAMIVANEAGVNEDWIVNGSFDGTETADSIRAEYEQWS